MVFSMSLGNFRHNIFTVFSACMASLFRKTWTKVIHFKASCFSMHVHKLYFCTNSIKAYVFAYNIFLISCYAIEIAMLRMLFCITWSCKRSHLILHRSFSTSRHHFYGNSSNRVSLKVWVQISVFRHILVSIHYCLISLLKK